MKWHNLILGLALFSLFQGCTKEEILPLSGPLVGFVNLYDLEGNEVTDKSGIQVIIENTSYSSTTDENGRYEFLNIPAGTYNLSYVHTLYGEYKVFGMNFIGGNVTTLASTVSLYQQPQLTFSAVYSEIEEDHLTVQFTLAEIPNAFMVKCYVSFSPSVSYEDYSINTNHSYIDFGSCSNDQVFYVTYNSYSFYYASSGTKVYISLYFQNPSAEDAEYSYYNPEEDQYYYPTLIKACNTIEIEIP